MDKFDILFEENAALARELYQVYKRVGANTYNNALFAVRDPEMLKLANELQPRLANLTAEELQEIHHTTFELFKFI